MTITGQNAQLLENPADLGLSTLNEWGLILVEGPEATSFLQNQLTNSVLGLRPTFAPEIASSSLSARLAGYCSPKGRLLASAWLALAPQENSTDDRYVLFISKDIAANVAKRLSMYVLRSKVKVVDASHDWSILGFCAHVNQIHSLTLEQPQIGLQLPDVQVENQIYSRILIAQPQSPRIENEQSKALFTWNDLEVLSAIPRIVQITQEQFVPQMVNFESVAGVDFKKGCYPGQEIVARSQYRGVIKRRLSLAHLMIDQLKGGSFEPGTELFHAEDPRQPAGMVVLSAQSVFHQGRIDLQIECKSEVLELGEIRLGSIHGPVLKLDSLPYPLIEI
jgi:folate-binding protein YgfZ